MVKPLVSVIVPVYGVEKYIERCARSLFEQTIENIEYIFVNDCTKDNSIVILESVVKEYPHREHQVRIIHHDKNKGLPQARKTGLLNAQGEYIAHCDSDDWVDRNMYKEMYDKAKSGDYDMVICDYYTSDGNVSKVCSSRIQSDKYAILSDLLNQRISIAVWNKMAKKKCYGGSFVFSEYNNGEDVVMTIQLINNSDTFAYVNKPLYFYYLSITSITRGVTGDALLRNCQQACYNAKFVCDLLVDKYGKRFDNDIIYFKYLRKNILLSVVSKYKYYKEWKGVFPEINSKFLFVPFVSIKEKFKFCLIYLGLYPFCSKLFRFFKNYNL